MPVAKMHQTWPYTLAEDAEAYRKAIIEKAPTDPEPKPPTKFILRTLTAKQAHEVKDMVIVSMLKLLKPSEVVEYQKLCKENEVCPGEPLTEEEALERANRLEQYLVDRIGIAPVMEATKQRTEFLVRASVAGWSDFYDESGAAVKCKLSADGKRLSEESWELIAPYAEELAAEILRKNCITDDEVKK